MHKEKNEFVSWTLIMCVHTHFFLTTQKMHSWKTYKLKSENWWYKFEIFSPIPWARFRVHFFLLFLNNESLLSCLLGQWRPVIWGTIYPLSYIFHVLFSLPPPKKYLYCPLWSRRSTYVPYKLDATIIFYPLLLSCHFRKEDLYCRIAVTKGWDFILLALLSSLFSPLWCEGLLFCHWCGELLSYEILYQKMRFSLHLFSTAARLLLV